MTILGAVLAGGAATRFGADKALAPLAGRTLLEHALASLAPHCTALVVCGRAEAPVATLADLPHPGLGPLGGLVAALAYAEVSGLAAVLTTACDTPALPPELLGVLLAAGCGHAAEAPTVGMWPVRLAAPLRTHLATGGTRAIRRWAALAGVPALAPGVAVPNVNTPAELAALAG